jgi:hypothetical protein
MNGFSSMTRRSRVTLLEPFALRQFTVRSYVMGHSRPSHFMPVLNNVRYASDSDHFMSPN